MVQFTIRPGHETRDAIVIFKQLQYEYLAKKNDLYFVFAYFKKDFYRDSRDISS